MRAFILLSFFILSGCSTIVGRIQETIEAEQTKEVTRELNLKFLVSDADRILACVKAAGGVCDEAVDSGIVLAPGRRGAVVQRIAAAQEKALGMDSSANAALAAAKKALTSNTHRKLEEVLYYSSGVTKEIAPQLEFDKREIADFTKAVHEATSLGGWAELRGVLASYSPADKADKTAADAAIRQMTLLEAYLEAYFRDGEFVTLDIDAKKLNQSAKSELKKKLKLTDDLADATVDKLLAALTGTSADDGVYHLLTKKEDGGFITRGGTKYAFAGVSVKVEPLAKNAIQASKIDFTQVGSDIVRIYVEALADEWGRLPAHSTSTACTKFSKDNRSDVPKCYGENMQKQVTPDEFQKVNDWANKTEAFAAMVTGQAIRGISWLSLNNEALAKLIETAVGVAARKGAEKVSWCVYACLPPADKDKDKVLPEQMRMLSLQLQPKVTTVPLTVR